MASIDLSPGVMDISGVRAGDRNAIQFTITSGGAPMNLTGYEVTAQARSTPVAPGALDAVIEDRVDVEGSFTLRWPGDEVRTLLGTGLSWNGVWDMQIKATGDTDATTVVAGKFGATMDVTRPGEAITVTVTPLRAIDQLRELREGT